MNIAVILAGGTGSRMGGTLPKQFIEVSGRTVLEYTVQTFEQHPQIDEIAIVVHPDYLARVAALKLRSAWTKVTKLLAGGAQRYQSSLAAIAAYPDNQDILLLHDAARPFVSARIITDCLQAMNRFDAVGVGVEATDTIVQTDETNLLRAVPPRARLRHMQTPQCFRRGVIYQAYERALQDPLFETTDDCGVLLRYAPDTPIYIVKGEPSNLKITYREDLRHLEAL
ncbi:MAG: 2-C-methyl-D-erythritol 4-phosphate cytidylyltransferase [Prevotellaceae bacterium]|nr:2-C-methyl-D-erythritol 4-phosphate cytidylyltransferase [Prevotellaceae bacterium]